MFIVRRLPVTGSLEVQIVSMLIYGEHQA